MHREIAYLLYKVIMSRANVKWVFNIFLKIMVSAVYRQYQSSPQWYDKPPWRPTPFHLEHYFFTFTYNKISYSDLGRAAAAYTIPRLAETKLIRIQYGSHFRRKNETA
jgi:hypothetical protein